MSYNTNLTRLTIKGVNAKNTGATLVGTTENGTARFYPVMVVFEMTVASVIAIVPTVSIGTNSATYNNILAAAALTGMTTANSMICSSVVGAVNSVAPNTGINVNVSVGATATTATLDIHVLGYYN